MAEHRSWRALVVALIALSLIGTGCRLRVTTGDEAAASERQVGVTPDPVVVPTSGADPATFEPTEIPPPPTPRSAAPTPTATPAPEPTVPAASLEGPTDWLRVNGFGEVDFGESLAFTRARMTAAFGQPERFDMSECGAGPMVALSWDDFSLMFLDDSFAGWFYTESNPALTSPSGVAPGIGRAELERIYVGVEIDESSLGQEFFFNVPAGYMGGFLTSDGQTVTDMFAGINCFFR